MRKHLLFVFVIVAVLTVSALSQQMPKETAAGLTNEALTLLNEGKIEESIKKFKDSIKLDDEQVKAFLGLGTAYLRMREHSKAEEAYRRAVALSPENAESNAALCASLANQRNFDEAQTFCDEAYRLNPESESVNAVRLETMLLSGRDPREVLRQLDLAVNNFRQSTMILKAAANIYIAVRNYAYAAALIERLIGYEPNVADHHGRLAQVYLHLARDADALAEARTAIRFDDTNPYANYAMGSIFYELGQYEEASEAFSKIPAGIRWLDDARRLYALCLGELGRPSEAADILKEVVQQFPQNIQFQFELANQLLNSKRYEEAIPVYLQIDQLAPNNVSIIGSLGMAYMNLAKFDEAVKYFDKALALKPEMWSVKELNRVAHVRQRLPVDVIEMEANVKADPNDIEALLKLGRAYAYLHRLNEAEKCFDKIYELDSPDPKTYQSIGIAYAEIGNSEKAMAAFRTSLSKGETAGAYLNLAQELSEHARFTEATEAYEKFFKLHTESAPAIMGGYAMHLEKAGKRREALEMYRRSLAIDPNDSVHLFRAGILSLKLGEPDAAKTYLETLKVADSDLARKLAACIRLRIW